ncbi:MAG: hypothetical protein WAO21_03675, partial [Verrucomicrobiia bacterium]
AKEGPGLGKFCFLIGNDLFCFMMKAWLTNRLPAMGCNPTVNSTEYLDVGPFGHSREIYWI